VETAKFIEARSTESIIRLYSYEDIKGRLKTGNAVSHSVQNILSSNLLSKNIKTNYTEL